MFEKFLGKAAEIVGKGAEAIKTGAEKVKEAQENANVISEEHPLKTAGLEIYSDRFKYKKKKYSFNDIKHLDISWLSKTTNGIINIQDARVTIYLKNNEELYITKTTMYVTPKLVTAYNYLANKTFENRLKGYTDQLEENGYFILDDCSYHYKVPGFFSKKDKSISGEAIIYTDGRVKFKDKKLSLFDATIGKSFIIIRINKDESFNKFIKYDSDIIFSLLNFIMENPQEPSDYINNYKLQKDAKKTANSFVTNVVSLMAKLSYADGVVSPEEVNVVKEFLTKTMKIKNQELSQMMTIFNQAKNSPKPFEYFATNLSDNYEVDILYAILDVLFLIALADGTISAEEELLLLEAEAIFGIKSSMYNKYKNQTRTQKGSKEDYYFGILGLDSSATKAEIKKTYRRLAMKFHPDKVNHLGEEFVHEAEIKMKKINEAYEYLKTHDRI